MFKKLAKIFNLNSLIQCSDSCGKNTSSEKEIIEDEIREVEQRCIHLSRKDLRGLSRQMRWAVVNDLNHNHR